VKEGRTADDVIQLFAAARFRLAVLTQAASCCKHFYAYSLESSDGYTRHDFNAIVNKKQLTETYNMPFAMCVTNAAPEQIMCS
jgi:beta-glucosidase-like glycosyl hydrolase